MYRKMFTNIHDTQKPLPYVHLYVAKTFCSKNNTSVTPPTKFAVSLSNSCLGKRSVGVETRRNWTRHSPSAPAAPVAAATFANNKHSNNMFSNPSPIYESVSPIPKIGTTLVCRPLMLFFLLFS